MKDIRIAIDGPASSGKSTVAKIIAKNLGYTYLDTGAMYNYLNIRFHSEKQQMVVSKFMLVMLILHTPFVITKSQIMFLG